MRRVYHVYYRQHVCNWVLTSYGCLYLLLGHLFCVLYLIVVTHIRPPYIAKRALLADVALYCISAIPSSAAAGQWGRQRAM